MFRMEKLLEEIEWFGKNNIILIFGCDANAVLDNVLEGIGFEQNLDELEMFCGRQKRRHF